MANEKQKEVENVQAVSPAVAEVNLSLIHIFIEALFN